MNAESSTVVPFPGNPETLPVVVVHHDRGVQVYCNQPLIIVEIDDAVPHDRMFVRITAPVPDTILHGPIDCSDVGGPEAHARKRRFVDWLSGRLQRRRGGV